MEVDADAGEKLMVNRGDFLNALENDIKPVSCSEYDEPSRSRTVDIARLGGTISSMVQSLGDTISSFNLSSFYSPLLSNQAFGTSAEAIEQYLYRGIITWGQPVSTIFEDGMLLIQQARSTDGSGNCILFFVHMDSLDDIWSNRTD